MRITEILKESGYEEAWELISQPVPEIQSFVKQHGWAQDDNVAKQIGSIIDRLPNTQIPAASISKLKNLANKPGEDKILSQIVSISGKPGAAEKYAEIMSARDRAEGRNRGYDVNGLVKSLQTGNYESPVILQLPTGNYVIGGRTRLYAALALGMPINIKIINAKTFQR